MGRARIELGEYGAVGFSQKGRKRELSRVGDGPRVERENPHVDSSCFDCRKSPGKDAPQSGGMAEGQ